MLARWLLLCCGGLSCCLALNPDRLISQYHKRHWQIEDGLPQNSVNVILEAPDGYLLVATTEGLARFDGLRFTPFDLGPGTDLSSRWVTAILAARKGGYWFGTQDNGVYLWNKNQVTHFPIDRQAVQGFMEDGSGALWLGTGSAILHSSQGNLQPIKGLPRAPSNAWNVFAQDSSGTVWIVTIDGLHRFQKGAMTTVLRSGPPHGAILSVVPDDSGELWIGTSTGLFRLRTSGQGANLVPVPGVAGPVARVLKDRHGTLWVGTWGKGLYRMTSRGVDFWTSKDGLPDDFIRTLFEDREGNLWIGTRSGGLSRWKDTAIVPFGIPEGFGGNFASAICEDPRGNVWLGTWRSGLYRLQDNEFLRQPTPNPTLDFTVRAMASDLQGNIWIGNWEGLYRFDGKSYRSYSADQGFPHVPVSALVFDRRGSLWLGTAGQGLLRFPKADPSGEAAQAYFPLETITALLEDSQGRIWAGTSKGAARISGSALEFFGAEQGLGGGAVTSISEDSRQRIWISTKSGSLALADKDGIYVFDKRQGLPGHALYRLLDAAGSLWISSARGILRLTLADVDDVLARRRPKLDPILYDKDDGLRSIEFHGLSQPSGWRARDGNLWFPTVRGFVRISPSEAYHTAAAEGFNRRNQCGWKIDFPGTQTRSRDARPGYPVYSVALRFSGTIAFPLQDGRLRSGVGGTRFGTNSTLRKPLARPASLSGLGARCQRTVERTRNRDRNQPTAALLSNCVVPFFVGCRIHSPGRRALSMACTGDPGPLRRRPRRTQPHCARMARYAAGWFLSDFVAVG